ncbi:unnamed protein product [Calypogeia fissa]
MMTTAIGRLRDRGRRVTEDLDSHYPVRPDVPEATPSRFRPKVGKRLSPRVWQSAFDSHGQLDFAKVIKRIQKGGVHPSIRGEVWEFLLGCFTPESTPEARNALRAIRRKEYERLKETCMAMDSAVGSGQVVTAARLFENGPEVKAAQENGLRRRNVNKESRGETPDSPDGGWEQTNGHAEYSDRIRAWKLTLHQIGLDVERTDRMLKFYENMQNRSRLWDILAVYAWYDPEIGYCQGMSDLCSPMVLLCPNEADAYWCFQHLMARVRPNFVCTETEVGVQKQLDNLAAIVKVMDPKVHQHLEQLGGGNYIFAFRMVMVLFRREFSFADTLYLWEMMWASEFTPSQSIPDWKERQLFNLSGKFAQQSLKYGNPKIPAGNAPLAVFCMAAIFKIQRRRFLKGTHGLDDVVKLLNETTGKVDAKVACKKAVRLQRAYLIKSSHSGNDGTIVLSGGNHHDLRLWEKVQTGDMRLLVKNWLLGKNHAVSSQGTALREPTWSLH